MTCDVVTGKASAHSAGVWGVEMRCCAGISSLKPSRRRVCHHLHFAGAEVEAGQLPSLPTMRGWDPDPVRLPPSALPPCRSVEGQQSMPGKLLGQVPRRPPGMHTAGLLKACPHPAEERKGPPEVWARAGGHTKLWQSLVSFKYMHERFVPASWSTEK